MPTARRIVRACGTRARLGWQLLSVLIVSFVGRSSFATSEGVSSTSWSSESFNATKNASLGDKWAWFSDHADARAKATTFVAATDQPTEFQNLYFSISRFSFLEETDHPSPACRSKESPDKVLGLHVPIDCLPVVSARSFLSNAKVKWIDGVALWIDFPDPARIDNIGYWVDIAAEIKAYVSRVSSEKRGEIKHVIAYPLFKKDVAKYPWITELLSISLEGIDSFKLWFFHDLSKDLQHWIGIERAVRFGGWDGSIKTAQGKATGVGRAGNRGELDNRMKRTGRITKPAVASLREAMWRAYNVSSNPNDVTLLIPVDSAGFSNSREMVRELHLYKNMLGFSVKPYSPTLGVPLKSLVWRMAQTKLLIGRHGPLLGCAAFLPPGSTVVEILPHRYDGFDTFDLFHMMSMWMGDVRHATLAMNSTESVVYLSEDDSKYDAWLPGECYGDDCMEAMEFSGVRVDLSALGKLLNAIGRRDDLSAYAHPQRATRIQTNAGTWYDDI